MPTVQLAAAFAVAPSCLYEMYLDPDAHAAITGQPVIIGSTPGSEFRAFEGVLTGTMLHVIPEKMIVQTWRSSNWPCSVTDSILILSFHSNGDGGRIELTHYNVPEEDFAGVCQGWEKYYWAPWRTYLESC